MVRMGNDTYNTGGDGSDDEDGGDEYVDRDESADSQGPNAQLEQFAELVGSEGEMEVTPEDSWETGEASDIKKALNTTPDDTSEWARKFFGGRAGKINEIGERGDELDAVALTDTDADGKGAAALLKHKHGDNIITMEGLGQDDVLDTLDNIRDELPDGKPIYLTDKGPNDEDQWASRIESVAETNPVRIRDHHDISENTLQRLRSHDNIEYVHAGHGEKSATMLVFENDLNGEADEHIEQLVDWTNARDLYQEDHENFDEASQLVTGAYNFWHDDYVQAVEENGPNLEESHIGQDISTFTRLRDEKIRLTKETAENRQAGDYNVTFLYGDSYHSKAASEAMDEQGTDIAVVVKPSGKLSFRSQDDTPAMSEVASQFGGGGGGNAAGVDAGEVSLENDLETTKDEHIESRGQKMKDHVHKRMVELFS